MSTFSDRTLPQRLIIPALQIVPAKHRQIAQDDPAALFFHIASITPTVSTIRELASAFVGIFCSIIIPNRHVKTGIEALHENQYFHFYTYLRFAFFIKHCCIYRQ